MTARQPKHAQPSVLAGLRLSSASQWLGFASLVALVVALLATVDAPAHPAAARAPAPAAAGVASSDPSGQFGGVGRQGEHLPAAVSQAPSSPTCSVPPGALVGHPQGSSLASDGIPSTALLAYEQAATREHLLHPACGLPWPLLAGIGRAESDHGRFAGAVLHTDGISTPRVIGIPLDGNGTTRIMDTDGGRLDGDTVYDRAVGPMQFIPSTWAGYGVDANADGIKDPFNIFDAAAASASYLCSIGADLTTLAGQMQAVRVYNDSDAYISTVLQLEAIYATGVPGLTVPVVPADPNPAPPPVIPPPIIPPPVDPGPPLGLPKPPTHRPSKHKPTKTPSTKPTPSKVPSTTPAPTGSSCPTATATATATGSATGTATPSTSTSVTPTASPSSTASSSCPTPAPSATGTTTQSARTGSTTTATTTSSGANSSAPPPAGAPSSS